MAQAREKTIVRKLDVGSLVANMEWTIPNYVEWSRACPKGFVQSSGIFDFKFDDVEETYKFELTINPRPTEDGEDATIAVVNRNIFNVGIKATLTLGNFDNKKDLQNQRHNHSRTSVDNIDSGEAFYFPIPRQWITENLLSWVDLSIKCKILLFRSICGLEEPKLPRESTTESLDRLLSEKTLSDFVIACRDKTRIDCHRAILANKSTVFKTFFEGAWNASEDYKIVDFEPEIVRQMIYFIYTNKLPKDAKPSEDLLYIGDKYDVNGLVTLCATDLSKNLNADNAIRYQCYKRF
jgi:hypothetical protein